MALWKRSLLIGLVLTTASAPVFAHSPVFDCYRQSEKQVVCEAGFSDGSSAAGRKVRVLDVSDRVLLEGVIDPMGMFKFDAPTGSYHVVFDGGDGHSATLDSQDIS